MDCADTPLVAVERPDVETLRVPVLKVLDGDGFLTRVLNQRTGAVVEAAIRFGFIDAPEMEQPGGKEAKQFLNSIIADRWLDLVVLTKMDTGKSVDSYNRLVCVPYLIDDQPRATRPSNSTLSAMIRSFLSPTIISRNIELEMVLNGWAWVLDRYGPDKRYFEALDDARRNRRGIWARDDNVHPWEFKKARFRNKRKKAGPPKQSQLALHANNDPKCPMPNCDGRLIAKRGKFGPFFGCSNFPRCRHSSPLK